jgi:hypothetical protein
MADASDPLGLGFGGAVQGFNASLRDLLLQQQAQKVYADQQRQQDFMNQLKLRDAARADQEMQIRQQEHADSVAERKQAADQLNADRLMKENEALNENVAPNTAFEDVPQNHPIIGRLQTVGGLPMTPQEAARPAIDVGPLLPGDTGDAKAARYLKLATAKQQAATDERQRKIDQANAGLDQKQQQIDQAGQLLGLRGDLLRAQADAAAARAEADRNKQNQAPKLGQRDNDTVVTVHQMMPLVDQAVNALQQRVAGKPKPQGGIVGMLKQIPERVERGAQSTAYSMGLGQPSDISNQIQLESLMQVMGSTPYLRGSRNYQLIKQIQQHLADPAATDEANLERLKQLQTILPGIEQAIYDVNNHGEIPHEHTGAMAPKTTQEFDYVPGKGLVPRPQ